MHTNILFADTKKVNDIAVVGSTIKWYSALTGGYYISGTEH
jgi:hypothetical protein